MTWHDVDSMGYANPWIRGVVATITGDAGPVTTLDSKTSFQHSPRCEYDGQRLLVSYFEDTSATNQDAFVSSFWLNGSTPVLSESHLALGTSSAVDLRPSICSKHSSGSVSRECMTVWDRGPLVIKFKTFAGGIFGVLHYSP